MLSSSVDLKFFSCASSVSGPLFCWPDGSPITRSYFVERLNAALTFCNLDTKLYKAHSFRIGAASWASAKGFSDSQIRLLGRWKSSAFLRLLELRVLIGTTLDTSILENTNRRCVFVLLFANSLRVGLGRLGATRGLFFWPSPLLDL